MAVIDVCFPIIGETIPVDHGYLLFAAMVNEVRAIHDMPVGIHPINGLLIGKRQMKLTEKSRLTLRLDHMLLPEILPLAGRRLKVGEGYIRIGVPSIRMLKPGSRCRSRLVVIRGFVTPESFLAAVERQMAAIGITGRAELIRRSGVVDPGKDPFIRRTLRIKDKEIVGYALEVSALNQEDSLKLQEMGLGGRRHMGCGIFNPFGSKTDE